MAKRFIPILLILFFVIAGCDNSEHVAGASVDENDTLLIHIQRKLQQKQELSLLKEKFFKGRMGRALKKYRPVIKKYAKRYGFDWRLIAAQIVQESGFREKARSRVGARGLMQLMPYTAKEISRELDIQYIMRSPRENITAGIYHLKKQYNLFPDARPSERTRLALASYNAGVGRVFDAQKIASFFKLSANRWGNVKPYLSMLKKSDWQLHLQVWPAGKPRYGYFYGYRETIGYVDNIWENYLFFQKVF